MTITNSSLRLAALVAGVAVAVVLMGAVAVAPAQAQLSQTQIQSIVSLLASFGADQATINNVTAALNGQATPGTGGSTGGTGGACPALSRDLQQGSSGADVKALQVFLNGSASTMVAASGAGSPGNETMTFGPATKAAVIKFQTSKGVTPAAGYVGAKTRAAIAASCGGSSTNPGTTPTTGGAISVMAGSQPVNSLAPSGANRVPFTTFTVTNNSSAAVTVNSVTVQRVGLGVDANLSGVVLLDSNGLQIGNAKTLNSNHQVNLDGFTLQAGQSMTFTVAGNIAGSATAQSGQVIGLQVVAINTGATVSGSLPISGASQTINTTLTLGTVSTTTSTFDPGAAQTKNIGDTGIRFTGIRFTAGSAEDLKFYSIRWRNVGTASASDISNVMTVVGETSYPTTLSADGKYYTSVFPGGIMIAKGNSIDVYAKGDLTGTNSASRTIDFDIDRSTDIYFVGQTYGYGVTDAGCGGSACTSSQPWLSGKVTTINAGTATTISKANEVASQNIAVNVNNQVLGGFATDFKGEAVSVTQMVFNFNLSSEDATDRLLTSVSLVNSNGTVVAGPVDATDVGGTEMKVTFTDTVTFPVGKQVYTLKGKVDSDTSNAQTITASTTPSGWSSPTGQTSGNSITISQANFSMNAMTVKSGALAIAISNTPAAQNVVAGAQGFTFANIQLDASQSGEDVRFSSIPLKLTFATMTANELSACQLYDGTTVLNGGSNVVNPASTVSTGDNVTFTFDNSLTVTKGTVKTLALKCNIASSVSASDSASWGIAAAPSISVTGVSSGANITETITASNGQTMTIAAAGTVVASLDSSSPSYAVAAANQTGVTLGAYKLRATNEDVNLTRVGLKLTNAASSSPSDLVKVYLYKGATLVGEATFVGNSDYATSTLTAPLTLTRDSDVVITVKGDIAAIGTSQPATAGDLIAVDIDTNGTNTQGTGAQSGTTVNASGSTAVSGVRIQKSFPTIAKETLPTNTLNNGEQKLLRFKVTANANGEIGIGRFSLTIATTTAKVTDLDIFAFTDPSYSVPVTGLSSDGGMESTDLLATGNTIWVSSATELDIDATTSAGASTTIQVPAGATRYFEVRGTVAGAATGASVQVTLLGDAAYPSLSGLMTTLIGVDADTNDDFIWSPNSTTTVGTSGFDWTNGFGILGLPSSGISDTVSR